MENELNTCIYNKHIHSWSVNIIAMLTVIFLCLTDSDDHSILKWNLLSDETTQVNTVHFGLVALFFVLLSIQAFNFFTMNFVSFLTKGH